MARTGHLAGAYPCRVPLLLRPRYWGAHLLMLAALAAAIGLGVWQLNAWKAGRAAEARDISDAAALPLQKVMGGDDTFPGQYLGQPVTFRGEWLPDSTLYVADRDLDGRRGYWVMTPVLVGKSAMPVVRGWSATPEATDPTGPVSVSGWLQASEGTNAPDDEPHDDVIPEMRVASIVEHVDADLYSGYVVAKEVSTGSTGIKGTEGLEKVTPDAVPKISAVTHLRNLLYAFQWWIFGGFAVYIWVRWCRDALEAAAEEAQPVAG
jgi:cytochrome oxidase assembly protein ShyY1